MFGKSLLVAPVTEKMYVKPVAANGKDTVYAEDFSAIKTKQVIPAAGTNWFDFWTEKKKYNGEQNHQQTAPLDILPLFVQSRNHNTYLAPNLQYATEKNGTTWKSAFIPAPTAIFVFMKMRMIITIMKKALYRNRF